MCGNHRRSTDTVQAGLGSPPRVREPLDRICDLLRFCGITPACAGTTATQRSRRAFSGDHPRVCGNHSSNQPNHVSAWGSPPRVREPRDYMANVMHQMRITPACAGTTRNCLAADGRGEDHPRVCGNHVIKTIADDAVQGSPPRVREPPPYKRGKRT